MIVRRLEQSEHGKTRSLWEEVFTEDTSAFLDYYYYIKTKDNQICSMLQLNPYLLKIEESERPSAYIIAVATKEEYRGRGFMGNLLRQALNDMYTAKVPFTFLMPAAEAIYTPYDFRFIYSQRIGIQDISSNVASGKGTTVRNCTFTDAAVWNAEEMAAFFIVYGACIAIFIATGGLMDSQGWTILGITFVVCFIVFCVSRQVFIQVEERRRKKLEEEFSAEEASEDTSSDKTI